MKIPRRQFLHLAGSRCGAAGRVADCAGASLSIAADPASDPLSTRWCIRCARSSLGGADKVPARHGSC